MVQSKHKNIFNNVKFATCFGHSNHHQADISVHVHGMFSAYSMGHFSTCRYMACSVLTVWDISVYGHDMFSATVWDISVHGHDMFSAYSMGHFSTCTWHVQCLQYGTFQYMDMTCSVLQYGTFQYMYMACSVLTVWDISVHGHGMFSATVCDPVLFTFVV